MKTVSVSFAKNNLNKLINEINEISIPITIVNSRGKNVVLVSEDVWNNINEIIYLYSVPDNTLEAKNGSKNER